MNYLISGTAELNEDAPFQDRTLNGAARTNPQKDAGHSVATVKMEGQPTLPGINRNPDNIDHQKTQFNYATGMLTSSASNRSPEPSETSRGTRTGNGPHYAALRNNHSKCDKVSQSVARAKAGAKSKQSLEIDVDAGFPGSHAMGLPLKVAVEKFIRLKFGDKVNDVLMRQDVVKKDDGIDEKLDTALHNYRKKFGCLPFKIISKNDNALLRVEKVLELGLLQAPRRDRDAANRILKRIAATLDP